MIKIFIGLVILAFIQFLMYKMKASKVSHQILDSKIEELLHYANNGMADYIDDQGRTIYHLVALEDAPLSKGANRTLKDVIETVFQSGLDVNTKDAEGNTPLHLAVLRQYSSAYVDFLVNKGANINVKNRNGLTPFMSVCGLGDYHISEALHAFEQMKRKVDDLNATDGAGWTALMYAARACNVNIIHDLLDVGVDARLQTTDGQTAYDIGQSNIRKHLHTTSKPGGDIGVEKHNFGIQEAVRRLQCARDGVAFKPRKFVPKEYDGDLGDE